MSNAPFVPLGLHLLQLATGSTSFKAQPCAPMSPPQTQQQAGQKHREKAAEAQVEQGTAQQGDRDCRQVASVRRTSKGRTEHGKITEVRKKIPIHTQARK